jgi:hypothetical protein
MKIATSRRTKARIVFHEPGPANSVLAGEDHELDPLAQRETLGDILVLRGDQNPAPIWTPIIVELWQQPPAAIQSTAGSRPRLVDAAAAPCAVQADLARKLLQFFVIDRKRVTADGSGAAFARRRECRLVLTSTIQSRLPQKRCKRRQASSSAAFDVA